ncbi:MAG: gamma-glutamylcyclotransferase [Planctomycetota bacterium]|nr:MAG: gamma-glutamylcyclotransferase [Planctomycetota bacterium]
MTVHVFVYGTLKSDQCRAGCWPVQALSISPATIRGTLYDLGAYPALSPGDGLVAGECWSIADADEAAVLEVLDAIEGYSGNPDCDLYTRVRATCTLADGSERPCWTYYFTQVPPGPVVAGNPAHWPDVEGIATHAGCR